MITSLVAPAVVPVSLPIATGRLYQSFLTNIPAGVNTVTVTANILYGQIIRVPNPVTAVTLNIEVTTLAAGNCRLGIYNDLNGQPGSLLLDGGTVSTGTTGGKALSISQALTAGFYWLAAVFSAAPAVLRLGSGSTGLNALGFSSNTDTTVHEGVQVTFSYAALPNPFGAESLSTIQHPRIMVGF